jgi:hypothetical protein
MGAGMVLNSQLLIILPNKEFLLWVWIQKNISGNGVHPKKLPSDIAKALNFYRKEWGRTKFVLIGYSLGAEIVPFIVNRLPDEIKSKLNPLYSYLLPQLPILRYIFQICWEWETGRIPTIQSMRLLKLQSFTYPDYLWRGEKTEIPELLEQNYRN